MSILACIFKPNAGDGHAGDEQCGRDAHVPSSSRAILEFVLELLHRFGISSASLARVDVVGGRGELLRGHVKDVEDGIVR